MNGHRQQHDVDAGMAPDEVLQRTADATRIERDLALAELSALVGDADLLAGYGLKAELRRGIDLDGVWSLR